VEPAQTTELKYTIDSLLEVKGVGPSLAQLILAAAPRCREDLLKVKGVGKSKADLLRGVVYWPTRKPVHDPGQEV
jgi:endonuclease III